MSTDELGRKIKQATAILVASGFSSEALRMEALFDSIIDGSRDKNTCLSEIQGLCSVKSLGDLYVKGIEDNAWLLLLSEIRELTKC